MRAGTSHHEIGLESKAVILGRSLLVAIKFSFVLERGCRIKTHTPTCPARRIGECGNHSLLREEITMLEIMLLIGVQ